MVIENRAVDPGTIQGNHRPISFMKIKYGTRANDFAQKVLNLVPGINYNIVGLVHKHHNMKHLIKHPQRACLMLHGACKVEFQPTNRLYSPLTFFNF